MSGLGAALTHGGLRVIFSSIFLQQIGVPLPAEPTLVAAGSLVAGGRLSVAEIAGAVLSAALVADLAWFVIGERYGARALRFVLRLSSSPEKYLKRTERLTSRWRPAAFTLLKFIPGLPMAGPILAGTLGTTLWIFIVYDLGAMALWAGLFIALGIVFHGDVERGLRLLDRLGGWGLLLGATIVAGLILLRWRTLRVASAASTVAVLATPEVASPLNP
jgi:membrane protein DedA with SNARE-associated domain